MNNTNELTFEAAAKVATNRVHKILSEFKDHPVVAEYLLSRKVYTKAVKIVTKIFCGNEKKADRVSVETGNAKSASLKVDMAEAVKSLRNPEMRDGYTAHLEFVEGIRKDVVESDSYTLADQLGTTKDGELKWVARGLTRQWLAHRIEDKEFVTAILDGIECIGDDKEFGRFDQMVAAVIGDDISL